MKYRLTGVGPIIAGLALLATLALGLVLWQQVRLQSPPPKEIPITEALEMVELGGVREVTISGNVLSFVDIEGQPYRAIKEDNAPMVDLLRQYGVSVTVQTFQPSPVPTALLVLIPLAALGVVFYISSRGGMGANTLTFGKSRARRFNADACPVTFADVAGVEEAKQELQEIVQFLRNPEKFRRLGARVPRGVLLFGAPGTGKTLISRAVAGEAGVPFFSISGSEFVEMFVGVGASRVRDLFKTARKQAPCIVFIDEIDAVGRSRSATPTGGNDEREQTLNQLLVEMDGFDNDTHIVVIGATNRPDILDPALMRPGRFDRQVVLDPPDRDGRRAILDVHARGKPLAPSVDLSLIAGQTPGFSGADLANLVNEAAILSARNDQEEIGQPEFEEAILRVIAGPERKSRLISDEEKRIIAYHEMGHALVMKSLPDADPIHKVSIISRGQALGVTIQRPERDRVLTTRGQLIARMAGAMGGRAAEELMFNDITTGARQDIELATNIARRMVCEFGMSELGTVLLMNRDGSPANLSPDMAARVDQTVSELLDEAYRTAKSILLDRRDDLIRLSEHLCEVETISGEELERLLNEPAAAPQARTAVATA